MQCRHHPTGLDGAKAAKELPAYWGRGLSLTRRPGVKGQHRPGLPVGIWKLRHESDVELGAEHCTEKQRPWGGADSVRTAEMGAGLCCTGPEGSRERLES